MTAPLLTTRGGRLTEAAHGSGGCEVWMTLGDSAARDGRTGTDLAIDGPVITMRSSACVGAIGDNAPHSAVVARPRDAESWAPVIRPRAMIADSAPIGEGSMLMADAVIPANLRAGHRCGPDTGDPPDHDGMNADLGRRSPGLHVAGGFVACDVADRVVATGVPARIELVVGANHG